MVNKNDIGGKSKKDNPKSARPFESPRIIYLENTS